MLIVAAMMAILAANVIPQLSSSGRDAKQASLEFNLKTMRSQIQMYSIYHMGDYPEIRDNGLPQLTARTNIDGQIGEGPGYRFGPYLAGDKLPPNPFDESNKVTAVAVRGQEPAGPVGTREGWQYDGSNGAIWPNHPGYYQQGTAQAELGPP